MTLEAADFLTKELRPPHYDTVDADGITHASGAFGWTVDASTGMQLIIGDGATVGGQRVIPNADRIVDTVARFIATRIRASVAVVETRGYYTAGDLGAARYIRTAVAGSGPGKVQSADGQWWIIKMPTYNVMQFGAKGDGIQNDSPFLQNAINFCYGGTLLFPFTPGDVNIYNLVTKLDVLAPINLRGTSCGQQPDTSVYGPRLRAMTASMIMLNYIFTAPPSNTTGGGSISDLLIDGNSLADYGLAFDNANTTKVSVYNCNFLDTRKFGCIINSNHSFRFFGCLFATNGRTINTAAVGGVYINGANCCNFYGCNFEANLGCGIILNNGYSNVINGGSIEGNNYHGILLQGTAQHFTVADVDFEANNGAASATIYDIYLSTANNGYCDIANCKFSGTATANYIRNNGLNNTIRNVRGDTINKMLWTASASSGVFIGDSNQELDPASVFTLYAKLINTNAKQFSYATPAVPATTVFANVGNHNILVTMLTVGTCTGVHIKDGPGNNVAISGAFAAGAQFHVPVGGSISVDYTVVPTWRWQEV